MPPLLSVREKKADPVTHRLDMLQTAPTLFSSSTANVGLSAQARATAEAMLRVHQTVVQVLSERWSDTGKRQSHTTCAYATSTPFTTTAYAMENAAKFVSLARCLSTTLRPDAVPSCMAAISVCS